MVYCGKPSRGCGCCKSRKIKCDEVRPACGQCIKSSRNCPGYPDEFDLVLRNETTLVKQKVHGKGGRKGRNTKSPRQSPPREKSSEIPEERWEAKSAKSASTSSNRSRHSSQSSSDSPYTQSLTLDESPGRSYSWELSASPIPQEDSSELQLFQTLELPPEAKATAFFFRNFILVPQQSGSMRGFLEYLVPMYCYVPSDSPLALATHSVSMALLSKYPGNTHLRSGAFAKYGSALKSINAALQDPIQAKTDETLLCVLLFGLYEAMNSITTSASAWNKHVDGAVALVKLRGSDQFKSKQSLNLFRAVRNAMLTSCIQRGQTVEDFPDPKGWMCDEDEEQNAANSLTLKSLCLPKIGAQAKELLLRSEEPSAREELREVISSAEAADLEFELWESSLPDSWLPKTVAVVNEIPLNPFTAEAWMGEMHIYEDLFMANITNDYRVSRIFCHTIIMSCVAALDPLQLDSEMTKLSKRAQFIVQKMVDDISSSVPFHMEYNLRRSPMDADYDSLTGQAIGGYFLLWPLFVCTQAKTVSEAQRAWLQGRIYNIASLFGLSNQEIESMARNHILTSGPSFVGL